jgi:hypothetical protein
VVAPNTAVRYRPQSTPGGRVRCRKQLLYNSSSAAFSWGSAASAGASAAATLEATPATVETATLAPVINRGIHPGRRKRMKRLRSGRMIGVYISVFYADMQGRYKPAPLCQRRYCGWVVRVYSLLKFFFGDLGHSKCSIFLILRESRFTSGLAPGTCRGVPISFLWWPSATTRCNRLQ